MSTKEFLFKCKGHIAKLIQHVTLSGKLLLRASYKRGLSYAVNCSLDFSRRQLRSFLIKSDKRKLLTGAAASIAIIVALINSFPPVSLIQKEPDSARNSVSSEFILPESMEPEEVAAKRPEQPEQLPIIDLTGFRSDIGTNMRQINEPTAWGEEVLYSAGNASSIEGPVLTRLFLYNSNTHLEKEVAISNIRFGEIYEGRLSDSWIVWLDTNQSGTNHIYAMHRVTLQKIRIDSTSINRPQISLWGDYLVWTGQKEAYKDEMHVFNLATGLSVKVEDFDNPTFGTSSPAIHSNLLVWAYPHPDDPVGASVIKTLDIKTLNLHSQEATNSVSPPEKEDAAHGSTTDNLDIITINPDGFAIYPATNGEAIAWLDSLNPAQANLRLTLDKGETIITVAEGVGRFFGIGEDFIVYTQQGRIKLYFWETRRFATLTKEGEQAKLSEFPVSGRTIIWYDATDPNRKEDDVKRSVLKPVP